MFRFLISLLLPVLLAAGILPVSGSCSPVDEPALRCRAGSREYALFSLKAGEGVPVCRRAESDRDTAVVLPPNPWKLPDSAAPVCERFRQVNIAPVLNLIKSHPVRAGPPAVKLFFGFTAVIV